MDPICPGCKNHVDFRRDFNIEEIHGGIGDKNYDIAVAYCEKCGYIFGTMPMKKKKKKEKEKKK